MRTIYKRKLSASEGQASAAPNLNDDEERGITAAHYRFCSLKLGLSILRAAATRDSKSPRLDPPDSANRTAVDEPSPPDRVMAESAVESAADPERTLAMLPDGGGVLETSQAVYPLTVTAQFEEAEAAPITTTSLPSFNRILLTTAATPAGGKDKEGKEDGGMEDDEEDRDVLIESGRCEETLNAAVAGGDDAEELREEEQDAKVVGSCNNHNMLASAIAAAAAAEDKVYADLDAVPCGAEETEVATTAATVPTATYLSYAYSCDGSERPPLPPPPPHGFYATVYDGHEMYTQEEMYAMQFHHHQQQQQQQQQEEEQQQQQQHPPPPPAHVSHHQRYAAAVQEQQLRLEPSAEALAVAAASGATLILPPDPTVAGPNDNHCILIQRVPQNKRKGGRGEESKRSRVSTTFPHLQKRRGRRERTDSTT